MKISVVAVTVASGLLFAAPAFAQFASGGGTPSGAPNISGAGTGLSAPASSPSAGPGMANPNAIPSPTPAPAPVVPNVYPGGGLGGAGLPPAAVMPHPAHANAAHPH